jgi:hypothetical protein
MSSKKYIFLTAGVLVSVCLVGLYVSYSLGMYKHTVSVVPESAQSLRAAKEKWKEVIQKDGPERAYASFKTEAENITIEGSAHNQAHAFGEALYELEGLSGLSTCDSSFEFGCYHSFFGVAVAALGIGVLPEFDQACKTKYGDMNLPCQHGIGHGVMVYTDYDLVKGLELCETISDLPTGGCSSGVFMEYNFHTMAEDGNPAYLREKTDNVYAPCDTLPTRFQASCYLEQVQWWQGIFKGDFRHIGQLCAALPPLSDIYDACYHGIGNYGAAQADLLFDDIVQTCSLMPNEYSLALCHEGASWLVRGQEEKADEAMRLCTVLNEPYKTTCTQKLQN